MEKIKIDEEFRTLVPGATKEELKSLEESLKAEGCRDPLVLMDDLLLDGHNRHAICTRLGIPYKTIVKEGLTRDQAKLWIICNQLGRRNITPGQRKYLIGIQYKLEKKPHGGDKPRDQNDPLEKTADKIAAQHHVSQATVKRAEKFAEAVDKLPPEEKAKVMSGNAGRTKRDIVDESKRTQRASGPQKKRRSEPPWVELEKIYCGPYGSMDRQSILVNLFTLMTAEERSSFIIALKRIFPDLFDAFRLESGANKKVEETATTN
jgi:hypothetical protein